MVRFSGEIASRAPVLSLSAVRVEAGSTCISEASAGAASAAAPLGAAPFGAAPFAAFFGASFSRRPLISSTIAVSAFHSSSRITSFSRVSTSSRSISSTRSSSPTPRSRSATSAARSLSSEAILTRVSSMEAGVAVWLIATRAEAVSSRLTALSGSWRAGM